MTGRYKAYAEYKDSGVEFAPKIPVDWAVSKVSYISTFGRGLNITKANLEDEGVPCVSYGEVHSKYGFEVDPNKHSLKCVSPTYIETSSFALLLKGDFVFADTSEDIEGSGNFTQLVSDEALFAGYHTVIVRPEVNNYYRFLSYLFDSCEFRAQIRGAVKGVKVFSVTQAILKNANVWLPKYEEQQKIANFLDHETVKIDTLIAKQEKLIELLKEKRQAVISHAVTKGLNPDAPMKDSGVEWLGDVPEHWLTPRIKQIVDIPVTDGPHETPTFVDNGVPFVSAEAVSKGFVDFNKIRGFITEKQNAIYSKKYAPKKYDIYMVKSGATTGVTAIVETNDIFNIWSPLAVIRCKKDYYPYFVLNFMRSNEFMKAVELNWSFGTQQNIGMGVIENLHIACPPIQEAIDIANYLQSKMAKYELLIEHANKQIAFMKERKTALISAAVTGKIDVRDWQEPTYQESA